MNIQYIFYVYDLGDNFERFISQAIPHLKTGFDGVHWVGYKTPGMEEQKYVCLVFFKGFFNGAEFVDFILFEETKDNKFEGLWDYCKKNREEFAKFLTGGALEYDLQNHSSKSVNKSL